MDGEDLVKLIKEKEIEEEQVENAKNLLDSIRAQNINKDKEDIDKDDEKSL